MRQLGLRTACFVAVALALGAAARTPAVAAPAGEALAAARPANGVYIGKTAQGHAVKLTIRKGVVRPAVRFTISGPGGCSLSVYLVRATKVKNGTFRLSSAGMTITGRFVKPTLIKGTIAAPSCESAPDRVAYTARGRA